MRRNARWCAGLGTLACVAGAILTCGSATAQQAERNQPPMPGEARNSQDPDRDAAAQPQRRSAEPRDDRPGFEGRREDRAARRDDRRAPRRSAEESRQGEAWLGVYLSESDEQGQDQEGVRVTHVYPTSPAARAGFRTGDTIVQINGQPVQGPDSVISLVEEQEPGSQAEFLVRRGEEEVKLSAKLGSRSAFGFSGGEDRRGAGEGESGQEDPYGRVPPYVMQLEHDRRMAEQHQRIEDALRQLQEEVRMLKEEIQKGRN